MIWSVAVILHLQLWIFAMDVVPRLHCIYTSTVYALNYCIRSIRRHSYYSWSFYSRVVTIQEQFVLLSQSLCWCRREQSSIEWLLDRQENLLVVADWFTLLFWVRFAMFLWQVFACACATQVFIVHTAATIWERHLCCSARMVLQLLCKSCY